ncbi:MAG: hypothetical protein ACFB0B_21245 [Thermonemataceae bacterium]
MNKETVELSEEIYGIVDSEREKIKLTFHLKEGFKERLSSVDAKEFILYNFLTYSSSYVNDLFIQTPYLWERINRSNLSDIFVELTKQEKYEGLVGMLSFVSKYLKLDSIDFYKSIDLNEKDESARDYIFDGGGNWSGILHKTSVDMRVIKESNIDLSSFEVVTEKLISEGIKPRPKLVSKKKNILSRIASFWK